MKVKEYCKKVGKIIFVSMIFYNFQNGFVCSKVNKDKVKV